MTSKTRFKEGKIIDSFTVEKGGKKIPVIIRFIKKDDTSGLMLLSNSLVKEKALLGRNTKVGISEQKKTVHERIESANKNHGVSLVIESNKKIIGSAGATRGKGAHAHTVDIGIAFSKDFRGLGIGKRTMKCLIDLSKENLGTEVMNLTCYDKNKSALNLYRKLEFKEAGRIKKGLKLHGKYYDEILMYKVLKK